MCNVCVVYYVKICTLDYLKVFNGYFTYGR